jgi:hypothetical protein
MIPLKVIFKFYLHIFKFSNFHIGTELHLVE